jgi:hypothetical protein
MGLCPQKNSKKRPLFLNFQIEFSRQKKVQFEKTIYKVVFFKSKKTSTFFEQTNPITRREKKSRVVKFNKKQVHKSKP